MTLTATPLTDTAPLTVDADATADATATADVGTGVRALRCDELDASLDLNRLLESARLVLAAQPFARLLDTEVTAVNHGTATLVVNIRPDLHQHMGFVHGGVISYAADISLTFAAGPIFGANIVTSGFTITYLRPAAGIRLRAEAIVVDATKRQAVTRCDIYAENPGCEPVLCATAQGTIRAVGESPHRR
ncbi:PaaI family thioesterase [Nocardia sp. 004]|uniref:PaaI family thioesterase n=1 Tax=Nocardia sp. 004 TaxID=3385978 RepID=UPI0039A1BA38